MLRILSNSKIITSSLLILLFLYSISFLSYKMYNFFSADIKIASLTEEEKRIRLHGELQVTLDRVSKLNDATVYLLTRNGKDYFYGRYFLYPKKIYQIKDIRKFPFNSLRTGVILVMFPIANADLKLIESYGYKRIDKIYNSNKSIYALILKK